MSPTGIASGDRLIAIRASGPIVPGSEGTGKTSPCRNIDGQPMMSTWSKPRPRRYDAVSSPRTPIEAERSSTARTKRRTDSSIGPSVPRS